MPVNNTCRKCGREFEITCDYYQYQRPTDLCPRCASIYAVMTYVVVITAMGLMIYSLQHLAR